MTAKVFTPRPHSVYIFITSLLSSSETMPLQLDPVFFNMPVRLQKRLGQKEKGWMICPFFECFDEPQGSLERITEVPDQQNC